MPREGGLGKGLSSLIPQKKSSNSSSFSNTSSKKRDSDFVSRDLDSEVVTKKLNKKTNVRKNSVIEVGVSEIKTNPFQPRQYFDEKKLEELASSIRKHGIIQPLIVTKRPEGGFELVAGERRFKASQKNGLSKVPVIVKKISDKEKLEWALIENIQRHDLNAIEEAEAYQGLIDKFNYTQEEVAEQVGKSRSTVTNILRLLDLSINIKQRVRAGEISEGHARALLSLEDKSQRELMANEIVRLQLSVREVEKRIRRKMNSGPNSKKTLGGKPEMLEFENKISQALGTKVSIKKGRKGGKFIVNYYSEEEFGNLFNKLTS
ncbi:MAG: ParB/RepB/Spo0J family partition protein [Candidatus Moranbacteria bacterium]|nr:ParB/RepB/Spo0J family partition protein [Candidatus Moranbacteria bacterium]